MARAPGGIERLWQDVHNAVPVAQLGGIVGDPNHSFGYHLARNQLPGSDYSVQLPADRRGPGDAASALDITLPPGHMKLLTSRLVKAAQKNDPRLKAVREFCGTLNGWQTYPWQVHPNSASEGVGSWDDSHLWHIHISFLREFCDNYAALAPVVKVLAGKPLAGPIRTAATNVYPYASSKHVFGPLKDPSKYVHGGATSGEKAHVRYLQARLIQLGYVPHVRSWTPQAKAWADGVWGPETTKAALRFKANNGLAGGGFIGKDAYKLIASKKARHA